MTHTDQERNHVPHYSVEEVTSAIDVVIGPNLANPSILTETKQRLSLARTQAPDRFLDSMVIYGKILFRGISANDFDRLAESTYRSPLNETVGGREFIGYMRGRADALREMANTPPAKIVTLAKYHSS